MLYQSSKNWAFNSNPSDVKKEWALAEKDNPASRIHITSAIPGTVHYHVITGEPLSPRVRHPKCPTFAYWPKHAEGDGPHEKRGDTRKGEGMLHRLIKEAVQTEKAVTFQIGPEWNQRFQVRFEKVVLEHSLKPPYDGWRIDIAAKIAHPAPLKEIMNGWMGIEVVVAHPPSSEKISILRKLGYGVAVISAYGAMRDDAKRVEAAAGGFDGLSPTEQRTWKMRALGFLKKGYLKPIIHIPGVGDPRWSRDTSELVQTPVENHTPPLPNLGSWGDDESTSR